MLSKIREQITKAEANIEKWQNRRNDLLQKFKDEESRARTHRLCKRGGLIEHLVPNVLNLSDEQFKSYLELTLLTEYSNRMYNNVIGKDTVTTNTAISQKSIVQTQNKQNSTAVTTEAKNIPVKVESHKDYIETSEADDDEYAY